MNNRNKSLLAMAGVAAISFFAFAQELSRNQTLYIDGFQWEPPTSYNPVGSGVA